ncbi:MAG: hypothetical protein HBSAPP04_07530 [Ignavibacteriaceae bacterium]|nr:MAG: hypothetical protein HBSAPP04_07530 [Ignavibacteriaceae bacterium]
MKRFILFLLIIVPVVQAGITGKLSGRITDAITGEPLIAATVMIEGTKLGASTDYDGRFIILNVPPGVFSVKVTYVGYEHLTVSGVKIVVDQTTTLDFKLKPVSMTTEEVVVTANTPLIQKDLTSSISVVGRDEIELLPVGNFTDLLSLQAGVVGSGSNLHIRGGRSNEVAYMIDGMYVTDPLLGGLATNINNDAIQEMSLLSGTFNAEYGNALSGIVNIVTRDGSDKFSGKLEMRTSNFGIERYSKLNEIRINGSFEGAIIPGALRFFVSGEQLNEGSYLPFGFNNQQSFFTKLTLTAIPQFRITISNRGSQGLRRNYNHDYKYIPEQYLKNRTDSWQTSFTATHTVANNFFYDLKASYFNQGYYSGLDKDTSQYMIASARVLLSTAGNGFEFWAKADPLVITDSRTTTLDFKGDAVWQFNSTNEVKFGAQFKSHDLKLWSIEDPKRNFPYVNNYQTQPFEIAAYVQDKIELPSLVINLGLRFDHMNGNVKFRSNPLDPTSIIEVKPRSQVSPRVGIAHPITEKTKLHFAYGHFFQNPEYQFLFQNQQYDIKVREPLFGSPDLDAQRTIAYEVGVSHQLTDRAAISFTAYYKDVTGLIGTRYYFPFTEGRYVGYTLYVNEDYANMKGFEVNLDIRPDKYFAGGLTYTYSVAKGSASSEDEQYHGSKESSQLYYLDRSEEHTSELQSPYVIPHAVFCLKKNTIHCGVHPHRPTARPPLPLAAFPSAALAAPHLLVRRRLQGPPRSHCFALLLPVSPLSFPHM